MNLMETLISEKSLQSIKFDYAKHLSKKWSGCLLAANSLRIHKNEDRRSSVVSNATDEMKSCRYLRVFRMMNSLHISFMSTAILISTCWLLNSPIASCTKVTCSSSCYCDSTGEFVSCIGDGMFKSLPKVPRTAIRLELRNYIIPSLSAEQLYGLVKLHELKLQQTQTKLIENGTFSDLQNLRRLELCQNFLENITNSTFDGLQKLRYLDLSSNCLVNVDESFLQLSSVEQLNLRLNNISQVSAKSFSGLIKVQYLNLDSNQISYIEVGSFQYLTNLAHLILSNNPLTTLSRLDFFGSRLQYIDISHMGLERIPQSLTKFVRDLRLAKNNLTRISAGDFDSYPYLGLLVLDDNLIREIEPDALGRQEYLMRLWLNGNHLNRVPDNLPPSLQALYMEENELLAIHSYSFKGLVNLEQLFLQRNKIRELSFCAFCDLLSLKSLDLQANQIENLTNGVFANLTQLEMLDLSQNSIKIMEAHCFEGLSSLKTLQLSRMSTSIKFDESLFDHLKNLQMLEVYDSSDFALQIINSTRLLHGLRNLRELNIMHNKLFYLRPDFPSFFPNLKVIKMSGNNWICDKQILWLSHWIQKSNLQFYRSYSIRCSSPPNLQFKPIMMLTGDDVNAPVNIEQLTTSITEQTTISEISSTTSPSKFIDTSANTTLYQKSHIFLEMTQPSNITESVIGTEITESISENPSQNITELIKINRDNSTHTTTVENSTITTSQTEKELISNKHMSSRLLANHISRPPSSNHWWDNATTVIVTSSVASASLVLVIGIVTSFAFYKCRKYRIGSKHCLLRRSSSISYYPQRDEISIVTVSEGTVGLQTRTHHGLGNKLYYIMENGDVFRDPIKDALPDPQLQELLPRPAASDHEYLFNGKSLSDVSPR
ncbi:leucine-rich repeat-containing protein 15-like [Centruroides sculpturatus]|uniref:leucine-rich repeat-containing protein 15-like n=1 Tax=Centruroides sculpturatus TaxID=218467 RepID=UPI000C6E2321|nr:leucine-rich repeat-containing protein 15-like [Centruroides sculpturatus]